MELECLNTWPFQVFLKNGTRAAIIIVQDKYIAGECFQQHEADTQTVLSYYLKFFLIKKRRFTLRSTAVREFKQPMMRRAQPLNYTELANWGS